MLVLGEFRERIGLLRFDKPASKGASPVPNMSLSVLCPLRISYKTTTTTSVNTQQKPMQTRNSSQLSLK